MYETERAQLFYTFIATLHLAIVPSSYAFGISFNFLVDLLRQSLSVSVSRDYFRLLVSFYTATVVYMIIMMMKDDD